MPHPSLTFSRYIPRSDTSFEAVFAEKDGWYNLDGQEVFLDGGYYYVRDPEGGLSGRSPDGFLSRYRKADPEPEPVLGRSRYERALDE